MINQQDYFINSKLGLTLGKAQFMDKFIEGSSPESRSRGVQTRLQNGSQQRTQQIMVQRSTTAESIQKSINTRTVNGTILNGVHAMQTPEVQERAHAKHKTVDFQKHLSELFIKREWYVDGEGPYSMYSEVPDTVHSSGAAAYWDSKGCPTDFYYSPRGQNKTYHFEHISIK